MAQSLRAAAGIKLFIPKATHFIARCPVQICVAGWLWRVLYRRVPKRVSHTYWGLRPARVEIIHIGPALDLRIEGLQGLLVQNGQFKISGLEIAGNDQDPVSNSNSPHFLTVIWIGAGPAVMVSFGCTRYATRRQARACCINEERSDR